MNYEATARKVAAAVRANGAPITFNEAPTVDEATGQSVQGAPHPGYAVQAKLTVSGRDMSATGRDRTAIAEYAAKFLCVDIPEPSKGWTCTRDGQTYVVDVVEAIRPAGVTLLYEVYVKL